MASPFPPAASALALSTAIFSAALASAGPALAEDLVHAPATRSPQPAAAPDPALQGLARICGGDRALAAAAGRAAERQRQVGELLRADELAFTLRAEGGPHVWPRAWSIEAPRADAPEVEGRFRAWLGTWKTLGERRCGLARSRLPSGASIVAAVGVDALADLESLPMRARAGQWLTLEARMLVPASSVTVVLLGPRGAPKTVPARISGGRIRSSFSVDRPGTWLVQVLAHVSTGPRPVLEARVYADEAPPSRYARPAVPGESAGRAQKDEAAALLEMINAARRHDRLPALVRDPALDALARAHAARMIRRGLVGHDVGRGDPAQRLEEAGYPARLAAENVASAKTLLDAHRALWSSPSHRGNLLHPSFRKVGLATARDARGIVYVTELFVG